MIQKLIGTTTFIAISIILGGCTASLSTSNPASVVASSSTAKVSQVKATGEPNDYTFAVTIISPDTGCNRYADWWEVITPDGELLYRRVLLHSHVDEQPFTRTGGIVNISATQPVIVRVHMSDSGYSEIAQQGSVRDGFTEVTLPTDLAPALANQKPLPGNCAF
ncbi:MAG: hypothetical protein AAFQ41_16180 [Cyanobacteria bacterium J06623_7]